MCVYIYIYIYIYYNIFLVKSSGKLLYKILRRLDWQDDRIDISEGIDVNKTSESRERRVQYLPLLVFFE